MERAVAITKQRRLEQEAYTPREGIIPSPIVKKIAAKEHSIRGISHMANADIEKQLIELEAKMFSSAERMDFESAITFRDTLLKLKEEYASMQ